MIATVTIECLLIDSVMKYEELKYLDEEMYSFNPVVNSVLRGCIGKIKGRDIKVETDINIPGDVEFFDGDFGTLLSNLVDNAIEACEKVVPERRYINLIIKVVEENMFIHIENSKISAPVDINVSTKDNPDSHGIGVARVKEIFDVTGYLFTLYDSSFVKISISSDTSEPSFTQALT